MESVELKIQVDIKNMRKIELKTYSQTSASQHEDTLNSNDIRVVGNTLHFLGKKFECAIGRNRMIPASDKKEGDGKTPKGTYSLVEVWYRPDRTTVETNLPLYKILSDDGWCDASDDQNYNKHVKLPYSASHEVLYRTDGVYDTFAVINYNYPDSISGRGMAIFFHIAAEDFSPTAGCVALKHEDLKYVLKNFSPSAKFIIEE
ncbi:MAG: L,D-transpeptidase family protein [Alphaproteobacteria bacterium]|nr:L,D-transpeptidase family protein [Alphaproteobacteria bacterium]